MKKSVLSFALFISAYYTSAQLSWLRLPDFPGRGKVGCASFAINGNGYMGLGYDSLVQGRTDWYAYDPALNIWTQKASFPAAGRWTCVSFAIGSKGYVITGATNSGYTNQTWEYDAISDSWTLKANFPGGARQNAAGFVINNKGYVGTGYNSGGSVNDFYEYDPATNVWTVKADFPGAIRNGGSGFTISGKGYMGLGNATNSVVNYNDIYEYTPLTDSWIQMAGFPITYINVPTPYASSSDGYILCGYYNQTSGISHNPLNTLYSFDPQQNEWSLNGTFRGLPRGYAGGFSLSNDMYICAGAQSNDGDPDMILTDFWKLSNGLTLMTGNVEVKPDIILFPNPVFSSISFGGELAAKRINHIRIYDVSGKLIVTENISDINQSIDISFLKNGIYFVELITKDKEVLDSEFVKE